LTLRIVLAAGISFVVIAGWHVASGWQTATVKYARQEPAPIALTQAWQQGGWQALPTYRQDIYGELEEPFLLQWQGEVQTLQAALTDWTLAPDWTPTVINGFALGYTGSSITRLTQTARGTRPRPHTAQSG
ncbi:MAG TPA: hypothetical protein PLM98_17455, partial [Thiolinea sp.]|nr:hypothetical protein [Thiolinea sp.]